jgi:putative DNA-invertase from lambdoid prophage Rac
MKDISKVALYCRVSTNDQSTAMQAADLRRLAEARGWSVVALFEEKASGRKTRAAREQLIRDAKAGACDAILVWKLDRWGRSTRDLLNTIRDLDKAGVAFISLKDGVDLSTSSGRLLFTVLSAIAEFEADGIRERVTVGLRHAARHGTRSGKPIGRPRIIDKRAVEIRALASAGASMATISRRLKVGYGSVYRLLKGVPARHR